jgi:hypothetical protein
MRRSCSQKSSMAVDIHIMDKAGLFTPARHDQVVVMINDALDKRNDHGHENTVWVYARNSDKESPHLYLIGDMLVSAALQNLDMNALQAVDSKADLLLNTGAEVLGLRV